MRPARYWAAVVAVIGGVTMGAGLPAQRPAIPDDLVQRWASAGRDHAVGVADWPAMSVASWPDAWLTAAYEEVRLALAIVKARPAEAFFDRRVRQLGVQAIADVNRMARAGAMLHADIAMLTPPAPFGARRALQGSVAGASMMMRDGEAIGVQGNAIHWTFGRMLLDGLRPDPTADPFVPLWYRATAVHQLHHFDISAAMPHLGHATVLLRRDAPLWLFLGMAHDLRAAPHVQAAIASAALPTGYYVSIKSAREELERARAALERAVALDDGLVEAHVRLARVIGLHGEHDRAREHLRLALSRHPGTRISYFALLFLGRTEQHLGGADEARTAFERAARLFPQAQSPGFALAYLAASLGDAPAAAAATKATLALGMNANDGDDPWWRYFFPAAADVHQHVDELWRFARQQTGR